MVKSMAINANKAASGGLQRGVVAFLPHQEQRPTGANLVIPTNNTALP